MRRNLSILLALVLSSVLGVTLLAPANADVPASQNIRVRDESPEVGVHKLAFRNYGEQRCQGSRRYGTFWCYKRVTKGTVETKLTTYRLKENRPQYDYYLLDVDHTIRRSGSSNWGWLHSIATTRTGTKIVDTRDTATKSATQGDCRTLNLQLTASMAVVSGSADLGSVRFCDKAAHYKRFQHSRRKAEFKANRVGKTNHVSEQRWVKVPQGQKPRFKVRLELPLDKCTHSREGKCTAFTNGSHARTYFVKTAF